jgi:tetratricopeptide (TPR) repeat protein
VNDAKDAYLAILARDPGNREALLGLADLVERAGLVPEACGLLAEAARRHPGDAPVQAQYGAALARAGDLPGARAAFELACYLAPDDPAIRRRYVDVLARGTQPAADEAFSAAWRLHDAGRNEEARRAYLTILARDRHHLSALTNLGTLELTRGRRGSARLLYARAVAAHPGEVVARLNYGRLLFEEEAYDLAEAQFAAVVASDENQVDGLAGLARIAEERGDLARARSLRERAYARRRIRFSRYTGSAEPWRVLVLETGDDGNVPLPLILDPARFLSASLVVEAYDPAVPLPRHDVVFNAVGDADRCAGALALAEAVLAQTSAPLINRPAAVLATTRARNALRLRAIEGVVTPRIVSYARADLLAEDAAQRLQARGFVFPLLLRAPGFHTGKHFVEVLSPGELAAAAGAIPGEGVLVIERLDARGPDGNARKYRAIAIDGVLYALHAAISRDWKVHYFSADMRAFAEHRAEDAAFLADMPGVIGARAMNALDGIVRELGLEYAGIDFGLDRAGNVLVFEANATMLVPHPGSDPRFAYRIAAVDRIVAAAQAMLLDAHG